MQANKEGEIITLMDKSRERNKSRDGWIFDNRQSNPQSFYERVSARVILRSRYLF